MTNSSPAPASSSRELPPITVDGHALFEFSLKINRALKRMEARFGTTSKHKLPLSRFGWEPLPKKPR
jgi:hypothetical protein